MGIWGALRNVYPEAEEQRCWNHRILNILEKLPRRLYKQALMYLRQIPYAETLKEALSGKRSFQRWCRQEGYEKAAACLDDDWDRMVTFYQFPKAHWIHLRTSNPIESPFAALRLRTSAAKRFKRVDNATTVIWKMLLVLEKKFRKLNAPELMEEVYEGAEYVDGVKVNDGCRKAVA
jgi:transposase-like protein